MWYLPQTPQHDVLPMTEGENTRVGWLTARVSNLPRFFSAGMVYPKLCQHHQQPRRRNTPLWTTLGQRWTPAQISTSPRQVTLLPPRSMSSAPSEPGWQLHLPSLLLSASLAPSSRFKQRKATRT